MNMRSVTTKFDELNVSNHDENSHPSTPPQPKTPLKDHNVQVKAERPVKVRRSTF